MVAMNGMKRICFLTCVVVLYLLGTSCTKKEWAGIRLDKPELTFSSEGGEETVTNLNRNYLGILYAWEGTQMVSGEKEMVNYVPCTEVFDGEVAFVIDGGWYRVIQPQGNDKQASNQIFITVEPNTSSAPRHVSISLKSGNYFSTMYIDQKSR